MYSHVTWDCRQSLWFSCVSGFIEDSEPGLTTHHDAQRITTHCRTSVTKSMLWAATSYGYTVSYVRVQAASQGTNEETQQQYKDAKQIHAMQTCKHCNAKIEMQVKNHITINTITYHGPFKVGCWANSRYDAGRQEHRDLLSQETQCLIHEACASTNLWNEGPNPAKNKVLLP